MKGIVSIRSLGMFILLSCTVLVCTCIVVLSLLRFNSFTTDLTDRTRSLSDSLAEAALASSSAAESFFASELLYSTSSVATSLLRRHVALAVNINRNARQLVFDHKIDLSDSQGLSDAARLIVRAIVRGSDPGLVASTTLTFRDPFTFGDSALVSYNDLSWITGSDMSGVQASVQPSLNVSGVWQVPDLSAIGLVSMDLPADLSGLSPPGLVDGYPETGPAPSGKPTLTMGLARQSNWQFVGGSTCPFTTAKILLDTEGNACPATWTRSRQQPCSAGAPAGAVCVHDLALDHSAHSVRLTMAHGSAALTIGTRVYDQDVTPRRSGLSSADTHGKMKGLNVSAKGNPYAACDGGCELPSGGSAAVTASSVFDDHLGIVYTDAKIDPLIVLAKQLSLETTNRFRSGMSADDERNVASQGLDSERVRIYMVDQRDRVLFASHGYDHTSFRPIRTLNTIDDPVAVGICAAIKAKGVSELLPPEAQTPTLTRSAECGLPRVPLQSTAPVITTVMVRMGGRDTEWRLRATPTTLESITCVPEDTECVDIAWSVVAVADAFVSYPTTSLRDRVAQTQSVGLAGMNSASDDAVAKTVLFVVIAAVGAALIAAALGVAFFLFLTAPVRRVAAMAAAVATMKYETINETAAEQGIHFDHEQPGSRPGSRRGAKVVPIEAAASASGDGLVVGDSGLSSTQRDPLEDALTGTVAHFRGNVLPLREISQLQLGFAQLVQTISSLMKYVPIEIALRYAASPDVAKLGMEPRETTVLFSDVVAFTVLCEQHSPRDVLQVMSQYFGTMTECVHASGGTVDKFIGDVVMAAWGAATPCAHGPLSAVTCAVNMLGMAQINSAKWRRIRCRIGIHDGKAMVGNIGSPQRFNFTLIGDMVNVASRLKGANRTYGTSMLFSESLMKKAGPELDAAFLVRPIGMIRLKGRMTGLLCYEVVACKRLLSRLNKIPDHDSSAGINTPPPSTPAAKGDVANLFVDTDKVKPGKRLSYDDMRGQVLATPELFKVDGLLSGHTARGLYTDSERFAHEHHSAAVLSFVKGDFQAAKASLDKLASVTAQLEADITAPYVSLLHTVEDLIENPPFEFDPCTQQTAK